MSGHQLKKAQLDECMYVCVCLVCVCVWGGGGGVGIDGWMDRCNSHMFIRNGKSIF